MHSAVDQLDILTRDFILLLSLVKKRVHGFHFLFHRAFPEQLVLQIQDDQTVSLRENQDQKIRPGKKCHPVCRHQIAVNSDMQNHDCNRACKLPGADPVNAALRHRDCHRLQEDQKDNCRKGKAQNKIQRSRISIRKPR